MVIPGPPRKARTRVRKRRLIECSSPLTEPREKPISSHLNSTLNMADGPAPMAVDPPSVDLRLSPEEEGLLSPVSSPEFFSTRNRVVNEYIETLQYRRLEVDERNVRKISKKFQTYAMALRSHQEKVAPESGETSGIDPLDEPRRALEVELGAFLLVMQKSSLVVQAEIMQAQEYEESKERISPYSFSGSVLCCPGPESDNRT